MDIKEIGRRIKSRRTALEMTQGEIAEQIGVAVSTVQRYEVGTIERVKMPVIEAISRIIKVNPNWLIGKSENMEPVTSPIIPTASNILPMPKTYKVPLIGNIACGVPILAVEDVDEMVDMPDWIHADFALRCKGDSMINARIFSGDTVYIRAQPKVETGEIAAVRIDDEATLKRVRIYEDHIILEAENPMYKPIVIWGEAMNTVEILGKAVAFTSMLS